jgi:hypothetical protein
MNGHKKINKTNNENNCCSFLVWKVSPRQITSPSLSKFSGKNHTAYHYKYIAISLQEEEIWDDQGRDGKNSFRRILEAEQTSGPKP